MSVVPDKVTPELGWRTWQIDDKHGLELRSTNARASWLPGEVLRARCDPSMNRYSWIASPYPRYRWIVVERGDPDCIRFGEAGEEIPHQEGAFFVPNPPRIVLPRSHCYGLIDENSRKTVGHGDVPGENCSCGVYALSSLSDLIDQFGLGGESEERVLGRVQLWGKVVPGDKGWRAEFAYPAEFFLLAPIGNYGGIRRRKRRKETEELALKLQAWDVPVRVFENRDELERVA